jgi:hypothetical protein
LTKTKVTAKKKQNTPKLLVNNNLKGEACQERVYNKEAIDRMLSRINELRLTKETAGLDVYLNINSDCGFEVRSQRFGLLFRVFNGKPLSCSATAVVARSTFGDLIEYDLNGNVRAVF